MDDRYGEIVRDYIVQVTHLEKSLVEAIIQTSSFRELLAEDPQFVGHCPEEYWAAYILNECKLMLESCLDAIHNYTNNPK